jgi:hypothetical protein
MSFLNKSNRKENQRRSSDGKFRKDRMIKILRGLQILDCIDKLKSRVAFINVC